MVAAIQGLLILSALCCLSAEKRPKRDAAIFL